MFAHEGSGREVLVKSFLFELYFAEAVCTVSTANWLVFFIMGDAD